MRIFILATLLLFLTGCGSMMFNPMEAKTPDQQMACVARLLSLPVPDHYPDVQLATFEELDNHHGQYVRGFSEKGLIRVTDLKFVPHELAHHVMHGHRLTWEENRANFVQRKYHTWCLE